MNGFRTALSRRTFLAAVAASAVPMVACSSVDTATGDAAAAVGTAAPPETRVELSTLDDTLSGIEARHAVRLGVLAQLPASGKTYAYRGDERFAMCSTFKTYAVAELLRLESQGQVRLDDIIVVEPGDIVENSPVTSELVGRPVTYTQLCEAALIRSDNTAGNLLLRRLGGPAAVTAFARTIGDTTTTLDRWEPELNNADPGDMRDTSTVVGLATGYRALLLGTVLPAHHQRTLTGWMRASVTSDARIRAGLPAGWTAADKTGAGRYGTVVDAGVVWAPDGVPLVLTIMSDSVLGRADVPNDNAPISDATAAAIGALTALP